MMVLRLKQKMENNMKRIELRPWIFFVDESLKEKKFDKNKVGKWMYFFNDVEFAEKICSRAVEEGAVLESKHSNSNEGVCCFYLEIDDIEAHKRIISFLLKNNLVKRTKTGKLYDISFKLDIQTSAGQYGSDFVAEKKLSDFVDLETGTFIL